MHSLNSSNRDLTDATSETNSVKIYRQPFFSMRMLTALVAVVVIGIFWWSFHTEARPFWQSEVPVEQGLISSEQGDSISQFEITVIIHVSGAVSFPGVYELPDQARVIDLVHKAGGLTESADVSGVNLARILHDAEQVHIPEVGETQPSGVTGSRIVNINIADVETLDSLPRIGPSMAERIVAHREREGPFKDLQALLAVSGIGPAIIEELRDRITF